jgi:hypothetical protein
MTTIVARALAALALAATVLVLVAAAAQDSPTAIRIVISARLSSCEDGGRFFQTGRSGWIPTFGCVFPPPLPRSGTG